MLVATVITKRQNLNRGSDMERNEFFIRVSMGGYEMVECEDLRHGQSWGKLRIT